MKCCEQKIQCNEEHSNKLVSVLNQKAWKEKPNHLRHLDGKEQVYGWDKWTEGAVEKNAISK